MSETSARELSTYDICAGQKHSFLYEITAEKIRLFSEISGDHNPLHNDLAYARERGFSGRVVHGVYQQSLASQAVGMWLIGERCLISNIQTKFEKPLVYPSRVSVESEVMRWSSENAVGKVRVLVKDEQGVSSFSESVIDVAFHGEVTQQVGKKDHKESPRAENSGSKKGASNDRRLLVISGATGGVMQSLIPELSKEYDLLLLGRKTEALHSMQAKASSECRLDSLAIDLISAHTDLSDKLDELCSRRNVWGVIHAASNPPQKGGVSEWDYDSYSKEMFMAGYLPILFGRWLKVAAGEAGARMVLVGSNYGIHNSPEHSLLRYGCGKSSMSVIGKALAMELASEKITVNTISPDYIPLGMNAGAHPRMLRMKEVSNPMKRLCQAEDLLSLLSFLMSDGSGFISGEEITLTGGKL